VTDADRAGVAILLSTYNGAGYLPALLDSLTAQSWGDWVLLWRDDGSTDGTIPLLRGWGASNPNRLIENELPSDNLGVTKSFMTLLRQAAAGGFRRAAFADQDDVWLPEKLAWAIAALQEASEDRPALYCARQVLVDGDLHRIGLSAPLDGPAAFPASLTQNIATGNTVVLNAAAISLIAPSEPPRESWHDWWCYLMVTAARGTVLRDARGVILYRQHDANVVGAPASPPQRAMAAIRRGPSAFMGVFRKNVAALRREAGAFDADVRRQIEIIAESLAHRGVARLRALALFRLWFLIG
jgi:glycosyltransferase involved in cell wall biosynthesis